VSVLKSRSLVLFASRQINRPDARLEIYCQRSEHSGPSCSWRRSRLETVHLHGRGLETQTFLLVREELLNILALIALELDDLTHLGVAHDGAIASKLLLDHLEDLLLVELLGETLDSRQGLATVALCVGVSAGECGG
jgi:hypothetical protein